MVVGALARCDLKDSGYCSFEKEILMCTNSSFKKLGKQICRALRKKIVENATFYFIITVCIKMHTIIFVMSVGVLLINVWLQGNDKTQSCKSIKKTSEKFSNYIKKQETKGSNNCVGEYKNVCEIEKKMFLVVLIGTSQF